MREGWIGTDVEVRGANNNLMNNYTMSQFLYRLKSGEYDKYAIESIDSDVIIVKRINQY